MKNTKSSKYQADSLPWSTPSQTILSSTRKFIFIKLMNHCMLTTKADYGFYLILIIMLFWSEFMEVNREGYYIHIDMQQKKKFNWLNNLKNLIR